MEKKMFSVLVLAMFLATVGGVSASEGPVSYWKFDEGTGTVADDSVGGNDGTIYGDTIWTDGVCGSGLSFDGDHDYVRVGDYDSGTFTGAVTIIAWAKVDVMAQDVQYYVASMDPGREVLMFYNNIIQGRAINVDYPASGAEVWFHSPPDSVTTDRWYHLAMTYDKDGASGEQLKLYIDGELSDSSALTGDLIPGHEKHINKDVVIGGHPDLIAYWFDGTIDEVSIYNRALSAEEINDRYQNPCGDKNKGHGNDPDGIDEDNPGRGCENKSENGNRKRC
jgi:hypothetical protein